MLNIKRLVAVLLLCFLVTEGVTANIFQTKKEGTRQYRRKSKWKVSKLGPLSMVMKWPE